MKITINKMTKEHLESIKEKLLTDFDEFWNENILKDELNNEASMYIVALDEEKNVLGYAGIWQPIDEAHITNIVVRKDFRRKKIGTLMLEELIKIANKKNLKNITLEVNVNNKAAIELYKKYQFEIMGIRKKYYNNIDDALIMTRKLNNTKEKYIEGEKTNEERK